MMSPSQELRTPDYRHMSLEHACRREMSLTHSLPYTCIASQQIGYYRFRYRPEPLASLDNDAMPAQFTAVIPLDPVAHPITEAKAETSIVTLSALGVVASFETRVIYLIL